MNGSENLNPHDTFAFHNVQCIHPNTELAYYCDYEASSLGESLLCCILQDYDWSYFEDIEMFTLDNKLEGLVNDAIVCMGDNGDAFHQNVVSFANDSPQAFGIVLYNHLFNYHAAFLQYIVPIFDSARERNIVYNDYSLSEGSDAVILRLMRGIQRC